MEKYSLTFNPGRLPEDGCAEHDPGANSNGKPSDRRRGFGLIPADDVGSEGWKAVGDAGGAGDISEDTVLGRRSNLSGASCTTPRWVVLGDELPIVLRGTGVAIWDAFATPRFAAEVATELAVAFDTSFDVVQQDMLPILAELKRGARRRSPPDHDDAAYRRSGVFEHTFTLDATDPALSRAAYQLLRGERDEEPPANGSRSRCRRARSWCPPTATWSSTRRARRFALAHTVWEINRRADRAVEPHVGLARGRGRACGPCGPAPRSIGLWGKSTLVASRRSRFRLPHRRTRGD